MRKIVAGLMMSVDGVVEAPETWTGPYFSPEIGQAVGSVMANGDTMLLGRVTYQTFAASFAGNTSDPMAAQMNATPKVVVSATLPMNNSAARIIPASTATVRSANTVSANVTSHTLISVFVSLSNCRISRHSPML